MRSVLCSIVCSNCAQCSGQTLNKSSLFVRFSFSVVILCVTFSFLGLFCVTVHLCMFAFVIL